MAHLTSLDQTAIPYTSVSVIGGGAWGTALANMCTHNKIPTLLWTRDDQQAREINKFNENKKRLPGIALSTELVATTDLVKATASESILFMIPAQQARSLLSAMRDTLDRGDLEKPIAIGAKGIERGSLLMMPQVLAQVWPEAKGAMLSGPSFAHDVAKGKPTAITLGDNDPHTGARWLKTIGALHFRPYLSNDIIGVALGGAVKNVLAIAAGIVDGMDFGENAHAALIARGFAEFNRLGLAMGASSVTMSGLSGLGDLVLTASSPRSRNMSLGQMLGQGRSLEEILTSRSSVSEGVASAGAVMGLAANYKVEMPVCGAVADIVEGRAKLEEAIASLMSRPLRAEGN